MAPSTSTPATSTSRSQRPGSMVEYIPDRLYLASYAQPPHVDQPLVYAQAPPPQSSPTKRSRHIADTALLAASRAPCYFSIDDTLLYNAFHHDFGPLHIGHLYRFAIEFHDVLGARENRDRPIVFWSKNDPRSRANAACMLACYMVLVQNWPPHLALAPIAQVNPPLMPFRDAGYSQADYGLTVQDVVYGVWKAREQECCALDNFDLDEYEKYERVENGDFNWITPHFLAFASPQHAPVARVTEDHELFPFLPRDLNMIDAHPTMPAPFKNVLAHFSERNIGLVVRLNSHLYSPSYFESMGIQHLDMIFDDGTCPPLSTVRKFIRLAHETITVKKKGIAVHCKAGLGRTGCLIGAYLIYRHGFTANEIIAFMRFMRPGMVVGPQQHWLHLNQGTFREWWIEERIERKLRKEMMASNPVPSTPIRAMQKTSLRNGQTCTPPHRNTSNRTPLSELDDRNNIGVQEDYLPAPTPGQPRKTNRAVDRHHPYQRASSYQKSMQQESETVVSGVESTAATAAAVNASGQHRRSHTESDEEWQMRMRGHRRTVTASPEHRQHRSGPRSMSQQSSATATTTTTTTTTVATASVYQQSAVSGVISNDSSQDAENMCSPTRSKTTAMDRARDRSGSASGVLSKVRGSASAATSSRRQGEPSPLRARDGGIRKTSGRIGSIGSSVSPSRKVSVS